MIIIIVTIVLGTIPLAGAAYLVRRTPRLLRFIAWAYSGAGGGLGRRRGRRRCFSTAAVGGDSGTLRCVYVQRRGVAVCRQLATILPPWCKCVLSQWRGRGKDSGREPNVYRPSGRCGPVLTRSTWALALPDRGGLRHLVRSRLRAGDCRQCEERRRVSTCGPKIDLGVTRSRAASSSRVGQECGCGGLGQSKDQGIPRVEA